MFAPASLPCKSPSVRKRFVTARPAWGFLTWACLHKGLTVLTAGHGEDGAHDDTSPAMGMVSLRKPLPQQSSPPVLLADVFVVNQSAHTLLQVSPSNFMTNF